MRTIICIYCQLPFSAPAATCPFCDGAVDQRPVTAANEDRTLSLEDVDFEGERDSALTPADHKQVAPSGAANGRATVYPSYVKLVAQP